MAHTDALHAWIRQRLAVARPGSALPTTRQLAATFGMSLRTVCKALAGYAREGLLVRVPGKGTIVAPVGQSVPVALPAPRSSAEEVAEQIAARIRSGALRPGTPLPSQKQVRLEFHVTERTVRAAFRALENAGFAQRRGKRHWVTGGIAHALPLSGRYRSMHVALLDPEVPTLSELERKDLLWPSYYSMQKELYANGALLRFHENADVSAVMRELAAGRWGSAAGLVLHCVTGFTGVIPPAVERLRRIQRRDSLAFPVMIDGATGEVRFRSMAGLRLISRGHVDTLVARTVARFALAKRHDRVLIIFDPGVRHSRDRQYLDDLWSAIKTLIEVRHLGIECRIAVLCASEAQGRAFVEQEARREDTRLRTSGILGKYGVGSFDDVRGCVDIAASCERALEQAPEGCLVVTNEDQTAIRALEWARRHRCRVPADLAVLTLEHGPAGLARQLSSCEPDLEHLGYLMAHALLGDIPIETSSRGFIRCRVTVFERDTTRPS